MTTHNVFRAVLDYLAIPIQDSSIKSNLQKVNATTTIMKDDNGFVIAVYPIKLASRITS